MTIDLKNRTEFMALWNALQQFVDNNDPDEVEPSEAIIGLHAEHAAAKRLLEQCDAHAATFVE
jgi:hypothetical protein